MTRNFNQTFQGEIPDIKVIKVVIYRRKSRQLDSPVKLQVNDSINVELFPFTYHEFDFISSNELFQFCLVDSGQDCLGAELNVGETFYLECSLDKKTLEGKIMTPPKIEGEYYYDLIKRYLKTKKRK